MDITKNFLKMKQPCGSGLRWFLRHYEKGSDYQTLLDALVDADRVDDAAWLLTQFGPTNEVRIVDDIDAQAVVFAGRLEVRGNINVDTQLHTGRTVQAHGTIVAGKSTTCGGDLIAGASIQCGGVIECSEGIHAQWGVDARGAIRTRGDLRCGWSIVCHDGLYIGGNCLAGHDIDVSGPVVCSKGIRAGQAITGRDVIRAAQGIESGAAILCENHLEANWGIKARSGIFAHGAIKAGESLQAGEEIRAGEGHAIYAGLNVRVDAWQSSARVNARIKPERLLSGWWCST